MLPTTSIEPVRELFSVIIAATDINPEQKKKLLLWEMINERVRSEIDDNLQTIGSVLSNRYGHN